MKTLFETDICYYYRSHFNWIFFKNFVTCQGRYEISRRVFWFIHETYKSKRMMFQTFDDLKYYLKTNTPLAITISCFWPVPMEHSVEHAKPFVEKEITLDIDMNDYGDVRNICKCGDQRTCCDICWTLYILKAAIPILKIILIDNCQFKDLTWVFSGRRGLHVHIQDERVMKWSIETRMLFKKNVLDSFVDEKTTEIIENIFREYPKLKESIPKHSKRYLVWPRFDVGLFKDLTHCVKTPLSIHAETKNICNVIEDDKFIPSKAKKYNSFF
jgi:DNA primase catalytic subunit